MGGFPTVTCLFILALLASHGHAEEARHKFPPDETLKVPSLTLTDEQFLHGEKMNGVVVMLTGQLRLPNWNARLPAVVLLHGSDGHKTGSTLGWREFLNQMGVATFRLNSFGGRGIYRATKNESQLSLFAQIYDTYRAVDVLAAHPRIDPSRIAVMGFSRGGFAALSSSMRRLQVLYWPTGARIAAHLPVYPACNIELDGELDIADAPIRELHGAADDWTLIAPCRAYIERLRAAGKDATMTEYPGALHSFDDPINPLGYIVQNAQTARKCQHREDDGKIINIETGKPLTYNDACVELGTTAGFDEAATEAGTGGGEGVPDRSISPQLI
ncbi:dienelactone hydrolase family protein [Phyllobacterium sp. LjRoot231]|uniref:dienelactone hydrolase family protein n=1 Tax=Phyllobacterium sp. LjRoot231 TaxID=3342289 RepID=UPI003ECCE71C